MAPDDPVPAAALDFASTRIDAARIRIARGTALRRMRAIDEARRILELDAFRAELGATIRCASPLLQPLLELKGTTLDEAVWAIMPPTGWPRHPRVGSFVLGQPCGCRSPSRGFDFSKGAMTRCPFCSCSWGPLLSVARANWFRVDVFRHSLEVTGRLGDMSFASELGTLNIEVEADLPVAVRNACIGRMVDEVIDHEVLRGRDWKIVATAEGPRDAGRLIFVTKTAFVPYRLPWVQRGKRPAAR